MKIRPTSKLGRVSVHLIVVFLLLMLFFYSMVHLFNQRGGEHFFSNLLLTIPLLLAFGSGIASFITGVLSFFVSKDRSLLMYLSSLAGLLIFVFGVLELIFPH